LFKLSEIRKPLITQADKLSKLAETYNQLVFDCNKHRERMLKENDELQDLNKKVERRRKVMLYKLKKIYPIMQSPQEDALITIAGLDVGNGKTSQEFSLLIWFLVEDDESFSSGLGYACHLALMISKYLDLPFGRYHLLYSNSRSFLVDMGDGVNGPTNYHLFLRGVERDRLDYTMLLLSSCIKQVRPLVRLLSFLTLKLALRQKRSFWRQGSSQSSTNPEELEASVGQRGSKRRCIHKLSKESLLLSIQLGKFT
jgi:hypothetical protein